MTSPFSELQTARGSEDFSVFAADARLAASGLRLDTNITSVNWSFKPSVGIVARDVDRLGLAISDFKVPLTRSVENVMIPSIRQNFVVGGRPSWEPLSTETEYRRESKGFGSGPTLVRTGALQRAATSLDIWSIGSAFATVKALPEEVAYGAVHQGGASVGSTNSFSKWIQRAKSELGKQASVREVTSFAFSLMDTARSGKKHYAAPGAGIYHEGEGIHIPARPFIVIQDEDGEEIEAIFAVWLEEVAISQGRWSGGVIEV